MNKYQKIALLAGAIILILIFGKTVTQIGLRTIGSLGALLWKFIVVIIALALIISFLKKGWKNK
jgi:Ca2+/H+ antiporter